MQSYPEGSAEREKAFQEYIDISSGKTKPAEAPAVEPTVEAPVTPAQAKIDDLFNQQWNHEEGSPEWNAIQAQIDALQKPAEAPVAETHPSAKTNITQEASDLLDKLDQSGSTLPSINNNVTRILRENGIEVTDQMTPEEAINALRKKAKQPTEEPKNAVQEQTTGEVGVRNAPAMGEGVGEQNKPEEVTQEGEKPKEEELKSIDEEYQKAHDSNDVEKAINLFQKIAKAFGYNTEGYHASYTKGFNKFETPKGYQKSTVSGAGFYFGDTPNLRAVKSRVEDGAEIRKFLLRDPEISYVNKEETPEQGGGTAYVIRNPKHIKSANLFEYDDNGNLIPLSKRFDVNSEDIRGNIKPNEEKPKTKPEPVSTISEGKAGKEEVNVPNTLLDAKTPEEVDAFVKAERQRLAQMLPTNTSKESVNIRNKVDLGKRSKALGMEAAAKKRQLTGNLTGKEAAAKAKREESNYIGKPVSVDGKNGEVIGNPFGRVKVRFEDGTESIHLPEKVEAPVEKKSDLETWADNTIKESKKRLNVGLDPEVLTAYAVKGAIKIARGVRDFGEWSKQMLADFGEGIRPHLKDLWNQAKQIHSEREKYAPQVSSEQESFAKKVYDTSVKQRGKPPTPEEMQNILSRKFAGITSREVSDLYDTASGKPKPPTPYAGVAAQPSGETISIRSEDQKDQVKRGILTSVVPAGEGKSREEITAQGNANLQNGADPFDALEKAKQGDFNALTTAKAYSQALAKKVSDALKKFGPNSPEYKTLAKQNQDYYQKLREAGTVASDILRVFQGQTDLADAADIARQYTQITGEEPSLSKHEKIRKIADDVSNTIEASDKAIQTHTETLDKGLEDVDVKTPDTLDDAKQQVADLSDAAGAKNKAKIDRLNSELEQTKKALEEMKQAKETGQDAASLREYYDAKIADLNKQLEGTPKYGKEVFEQAQKIVDKWKADRIEAEKLLTKQLSQLGAFPDPTIIGTLARIMRGHIGELGLDFAKSSKMLIEKFGNKIEPFLKDAWAKAQELIKGESGGEKAVKSVRKVTTKAKAKPESKMSPEEKKINNLKKRLDQYQKKIDDINSGKVSTPKEVESVTNEEIKGLESDLEQRKQELADARLKAKQKELFAEDKLGEKLNPEQVKTLWESAKKFYLGKGETDYDKMMNDMATDFGITPNQVREAFASPKGSKKTSDELYLKQRDRQLALNRANRWLDNQKASLVGKLFGAAAERTFKLAIFGHGTAFIGTHAPTTIYTHPRAAFKAWLKGLSYSFRGKNGRIQNVVDNKDLIYRPNWVTAKRAGLENDPFQNEHEGPSKATSDSILGRSLDAITGGRGFDALYHLRQDMFDQAWNQLSITKRTPEMAEMIADSINNSTGFTKGGKNTAGILQSPITKVLFFAPKLIASRFNWLIGDPARMIGTFAKMANPFAKVTPEERMSAMSEAKNKLVFLGTLAGTLLANQALLSVTGSNQSVNFTDPKKNDWLAYKGFGYQLGIIGSLTRITRLVAQEYNAVFGQLSRLQKARGGREAAMKDALYSYFRSGFSPIVRDIVVASTGKDYLGNVVPWSSEQPDRGRRRLTWKEIIQEQLAPIPISEAATQKEPLPALAKAGTAAFLGARLETPTDIEEYEKSLQAKPKHSSSSPFGSFGGKSTSRKNPFGGF
jgi:hypothetical protein